MWGNISPAVAVQEYPDPTHLCILAACKPLCPPKSCLPGQPAWRRQIVEAPDSCSEACYAPAHAGCAAQSNFMEALKSDAALC